jgi:hypothetical protein
VRAPKGESKTTHKYLGLDFKRIPIRPFATRLLVEKTEIGEEGLGVGTKENTRDSLFQWFALFRAVL